MEINIEKVETTIRLDIQDTERKLSAKGQIHYDSDNNRRIDCEILYLNTDESGNQYSQSAGNISRSFSEGSYSNNVNVGANGIPASTVEAFVQDVYMTCDVIIDSEANKRNEPAEEPVTEQKTTKKKKKGLFS